MNLSTKRFKEVTKKTHTNHLNIGSGKDISIAELSNLIQEVVGFKGEISFNEEMLEGTPKQLLDVSLVENLGWKPKIPLKEGLIDLYRWDLKNIMTLRV